MLIDFLGTGAAWPIPRLGCDCEQCTSTDPRDERLRSSLLVDRRVLVDAGPDAYRQLRRAGVVPEAVVVTHSHHDHTLGLHELAKLRLPLYLTKASEREIRKLFPRLDYRIMHIAPGIPVDLGEGLELRAFDVEHGSTPTLGLRLQRDGRSVAYMPDLGAPPASKLARNADLAVVDGSSRSRPVGGHLPMEQMLAVAAKLRPGRTLFTHIGHRTGTQVELEEWLPDGFGVAYDGLQVDV